MVNGEVTDCILDPIGRDGEGHLGGKNNSLRLRTASRRLYPTRERMEV